MPPQGQYIPAFSLPVELYHQIILLLDVTDIFALRKATCKHFLALTQERGLWSAMYTRLRATQALPYCRSEFMAMSSTRAERALLAAHKVESSFLKTRGLATHHILTMGHPCSLTSAGSLRVLTFVSDRFLLSVDDGLAVIWDTSTLASPSSGVPPSCWARFELSNFVDYAVCCSTLYIATTRVYEIFQTVTIFSLNLPQSGLDGIYQRSLCPEVEFPLHDSELFRDIDPCSSRALLYSSPTSIHILHWGDESGKVRRSIIDVQVDDFEMWNGIISLRFCGPYILCFRVHSVEAYPAPTDAPTTSTLPVLQYRLGPVCLRTVSLSRVQGSRCSSGEVYTIFMLANDVYQGMFHYYIRVTATPVPSMSVGLLAKGSIRMSEWPPLIPGTNIRYTMEEMIARMFVSAWSLGLTGLRGAWVDRQRGHIDRRVVAFTTHPSRLHDKEAPLAPALEKDPASDEAPNEAPTMDGNVVHVISSLDLQDDVTICAVSEWTGRIALGSRAGTILLI